MAFQNTQTERMAAFIRAIGIDVIETALTEETFIPGIYIAEGKLLVDEAHLLYPGDLLHEAGHIALIPANQRKYATDNVENIEEIGDAYEVESIAWSWAAVVELGIDPAILFHNHGYKGNAQPLLQSFQLGVYPGLKRLEDFGMAYTHDTAAKLGTKPFPAMQKWLRE